MVELKCQTKKSIPKDFIREMILIVLGYFEVIKERITLTLPISRTRFSLRRETRITADLISA